MKQTEPRIRQAEAVTGATVARCPECGRTLPGGKLPVTRIYLPQKDPIPGTTERPPLPEQCQTCANPLFYIPSEV